ncbi:MAG: cobalamin-binding protein [Acidobacteria bacterium]|nr:MAG: cobalamin-binding protein [Acidobacteriota bacterium]
MLQGGAKLTAMRICSFLPSATEMVCALGLADSLVGITYECDFPPEALAKTVVVTSRLAHASSAGEIDRQVSEFMARGESLYQIDADTLRRVKPDLILTQDLCHVCAASPGDLKEALGRFDYAPQVLSLNPNRLADVWQDILTVGKAAGRATEAAAMVASLDARVREVERATAKVSTRPRVACLEWLDPPYIAGHWVPEMLSIAGGEDVLGKVAEPGFRSEWAKVYEAQPEIIVVAPCGYHLAETVKEFRGMKFPAGWEELPAVESRRVFAVDASSYFSRPGPRLAAGVEILAELIHPGLIRVELPPASFASLA